MHHNFSKNQKRNDPPDQVDRSALADGQLRKRDAYVTPLDAGPPETKPMKQFMLATRVLTHGLIFSPKRTVHQFLGLFSVGLTCLCAEGQSYLFKTFAGDIGFGSQDGTNTDARFRNPQGVTTDSAGNLYIADTGNHCIRRVIPIGSNWVSATLAGVAGVRGNADGTNGAARFDSPAGIAIDPGGNLCVVNSGNHTVQQISPTGTNWVTRTIAGLSATPGSADGTNSEARFSSPQGIAVDLHGNLYVADTDNHTIRKLSPADTNWVTTTLAGLAGSSGSSNGTGSEARFYSPSALVVDQAGSLYVSDTYNHIFRKVTPDGTVSTIAGLAGADGATDGSGSAARFDYPRGVCLDSGGALYTGDSYNGTVRRIAYTGGDWVVSTIAGSASLAFADGTNASATFCWPYGITVDAATNLYVTDYFNHALRKVSPTGSNWVVRTLAGVSSRGATDGTNNQARYLQPAGIAMDPSGGFYICDMLNNTIRKITPQGPDYIVTTIAGKAGSYGKTDGTNSQARFDQPQGVALDTSGNLYIADSYNNAIRKITPVGTNWVTSTLGGVASGLYYPIALALDPGGVIYVVNSGTHSISMLSFSGGSWVLSTVAGLPDSAGSADGTNTGARFYYPNGIALDSQTNLYVTDTFNNTIRQVTPIGTNWVVTTLAGLAKGQAGTVDGTNGNARFQWPLGIALDPAGNLYVSQFFNLRKMTRYGTNWVVSTIKGDNPRFFEPNALLVGPDGNLYVTDTGNNVLRSGQPLFPLNSSLVASQLILSWETNAHDYTLEMAHSLDAPVWLPITNGVTILGDSFFRTNDVSPPAGYYRLHKQ